MTFTLENSINQIYKNIHLIIKINTNSCKIVRLIISKIFQTLFKKLSLIFLRVDFINNP